MKRSQKLQNQKQRLQKSEPSKNWTLCLITVVMAMENIGILYAFDIQRDAKGILRRKDV